MKLSLERQRWLVNYFGNKIYIGSFFMWIVCKIESIFLLVGRNLFIMIEGLAEVLVAIGIKIMFKLDPKEGRKMVEELEKECECEDE